MTRRTTGRPGCPPAARRRHLTVFLLAALVVASCTRSESSSTDDTAPAVSAASTVAPSPADTTPPTNGSVLTEQLPTLESIRLAAPVDCGSNPYCADGLARVYGIEVGDLIIPTEPGAPMAAAVRDGMADVGVLFSDDPELSAPDLVALVDDLGMVASENIVPWARTSLVTERGDGLRAAIDEITAALTEDDLRNALAAVRAGSAPADAAGSFAAATGGTGQSVQGDDPVRIGAEAFPTDQVLANVYALGLAARGVPAEVVPLDGFRALEVAAMIDGEIDLGIEYAASLLEYVDGFAGRASSDSEVTLAALSEVLALADHEVFAASNVQSRNVFVMRADVAQRNGIANLSDLARYAPPADVQEPPSEVPELDDPFAIFGADDLRIGSEGPDVRELQELLTQIGYDPGPLNGIFEEPTRRAVAAFQVDAGTAPDGIVGPITLQALRDAVAAGRQATTRTLTESGSANGNEIHLTFDDGPSAEFTPQILDLLARYDARAVFFNIGNQVDAGADTLRRAVDEGHRIGNHTWSHPSLDGISAASFRDEIGRTQDAIEAATGVRPTCLRPPYGATDGSTRDLAGELGLSVELWNVDPQDWARPGVDAIVSNVIEHAGPGDVVLMHDGGGDRDQTIAALGQILEHFSSQGSTFTPIPGC